jgi:glycosyltransferase involved in cell wall biosynthesis
MRAISILLLAHQSAWCIDDAIQSVIGQSFQDWECLICDDASTDGTEEIVRPYLADRRFRYFRHETNVKQGANWGYAIDQSQSPLIATLHADDVWLPNTLETFVKTFDRNPECDLVSAGWIRVDRCLKPLQHQPPVHKSLVHDRGEAVRQVLLEHPPLPSASAFRKCLAEKAGSPSVEYGMLCDRDYFVRLAVHARHYAVVDDVVLKYRVHEGSVTTQYNRDHRLINELLDFESQLPRHLSSVPGGNQIAADFKTQIADFYFRCGLTMFLQGQSAEAKKIIDHALANNHDLLRNVKNRIKWLIYRLGESGRLPLGWIHGRNRYVTETT